MKNTYDYGGNCTDMADMADMMVNAAKDLNNGINLDEDEIKKMIDDKCNLSTSSVDNGISDSDLKNEKVKETLDDSNDEPVDIQVDLPDFSIVDLIGIYVLMSIILWPRDGHV